jgi:hypothetical protein
VHPLKDAFGHSFGIVGRCNVLQEDHKFIATEPGDRIDAAYTLQQPLRKRSQDVIPGGVAERVIVTAFLVGRSV